ncbi:hypothetical protein [Deinococcus cellulosilyticus]|uniref:Uncharacterized protein n=1 Tax=Deinococcus cellulosilyticus (strain DSM 18568 / NBRC 106333 / KACC 11606 / 5516J-15) TaxID=1223518 RepID=A0A511N788_DEIC1|nr:hypothetical protein [Deinococcus cellulosilyticus]GEM48700.1 hypothetical protein DC3_43350 [Deinococcus cellulosilyticus NBRC 106333 = KACC 11606]
MSKKRLETTVQLVIGLAHQKGSTTINGVRFNKHQDGRVISEPVDEKTAHTLVSAGNYHYVSLEEPYALLDPLGEAVTKADGTALTALDENPRAQVYLDSLKTGPEESEEGAELRELQAELAAKDAEVTRLKAFASDLKARNAALEAENAALKQRLAELEAAPATEDTPPAAPAAADAPETTPDQESLEGKTKEELQVIARDLGIEARSNYNIPTLVALITKARENKAAANAN